MIRDHNNVPLFFDDVYTAQEVASLLRVSPKTLERWRKKNTGPPYTKLPNREIRYAGNALNTWWDQHQHDMDEERNGEQPEQDE